MSEPHTQPESHAPVAHDEAHGHEGHISDKTFMKVFGILLVCTMISFGANQLIGPQRAVMNFIVILGVAVLKASLVVLFFMHLISERHVIFVILAFTVAFFLVLMILPILTNLDHVRI